VKAKRPPNRDAAPAGAVEPLLVRASLAARLCGLSEATWHRLRSAGQIPEPLKVGGAVLWRTSDLQLWVAWGCPAGREFAARRTVPAGGKAPA
jgi:predicted DNA-binding transcriptional regulator AlpA